MKISYIKIRNFKSIEELVITDVESALILVGKNNSGKGIILQAIRAVIGDYTPTDSDFNNQQGNIVIDMHLKINEKDLKYLHVNGLVSKYKHYDLWEKEFKNKMPSYNNGVLKFEYVYRRDGIIQYRDGYKKNNTYIKSILPKIYYVDHQRNKSNIQEDILMLQGRNSISEIKDNKCIFDQMKNCNQCFSCIGYINKKHPQDLSLIEITRLFQYKLFDVNLNRLSEKLNRYFAKNGGKSEKIRYEIKFDIDEVIKIDTIVKNSDRNVEGSINNLGEGLRSIYILSLLEVYVETENIAPYIIMIEDPEIFLHPQLQKVAGEILYRLSKKNQVIYSTHSPVMLYNFTSKQIKQVLVNENFDTIIKNKTDIDEILDDLGYTANDLMNVNFVFIVEGKQDRSRLPLLLEKYYSEIHDKEGGLKRIAIITTNSCTNIKTYANLKYINSLYLKDQFMMIRDGDGRDRNLLAKQLCKYYEDRSKEDIGNLPRVTQKNVLILKYYSFENYFLNPKIMTKIGVVESEEQFYEILYSKYKEYLYKLTSTKNMLQKKDIHINSIQDLKDNMENIKIYVRGHNLFDIFYGRYKGKKENEILKKYIENADRSDFEDILTSIDQFIYFNSRKI